MALEHLLAALERDAAEQAQRLLANARTEAAKITGAAEERNARRRRDVIGAHEAEQRATAEVALAAARREARRQVLEARQRLLDRIFAAARGRLPAALRSDAYRAALPVHVAEALAFVGDAPAVIGCPRALAASIRKLVAGNGRLSVTVDAAVGSGFRIATTDGAVEVDNTLEGRLERLRPRLALAVLERLGAVS